MPAPRKGLSGAVRKPSLRRRGFDRSTKSHGVWSVRCSQCEALVINGVPAHEHGCPNIPKVGEEVEREE